MERYEEGKTLFLEKKFRQWKYYGMGCFLQPWNSSIFFHFIKDEQQRLRQCLDTHLLPFLRRFRRKKYTFQLDNASIYTSSTTFQWFSANHIQVLKWPACTPDLNPKENFWGIHVSEVYANNKQFQSSDELKAAILNIWSKTQVTLCTA